MLRDLILTSSRRLAGAILACGLCVALISGCGGRPAPKENPKNSPGDTAGAAKVPAPVQPKGNQPGLP